MAYDIPSISDLEAIHLLNKHYAEVVTSKKDGIASGSDITQTTNPITGVTRRTLYKILDDMDDTFLERLLKMAFTPVGTFTAGATLTDARQTLLWEVSKGGDGHHYSWSGSFGTSGKVVTAGSSPSPIEAGSWVDRTDDSLRDEIRETVFQNIKRLAKEAGYNLVDGSFQTGAVTVNQNDVVWDWSSGKYYGGVIGSVSAGSTPATSGGVGVGAWVDRTNLTFRSEISDIDGAGLIGSMSYAQLRAYSGPHTTVNVWGISNVFDGAAGQFRVNASDTASADNGGTILVDSLGRRWYRIFSGDLDVRWFGALGDGSTDDTFAFHSALNSLIGIKATVRFYNRHRIAGNLSVPDGVCLMGPTLYNAGNTGYANSLATTGASLLLGSSATITLGNNAGLVGVLLQRYGMSWYETSPSAFAGTAITGAGNDCYVMGSFIAGFNTAFYSNGAERVKLSDIYGDCLNGINIQTSYDKSYLNNCHFWPFVTQQNGLPASAQRRSGIAFEFGGVSSYGTMHNCFSYGYYRGFLLQDANDCVLSLCGADGDSGYTGSIGFLISGNCAGNNLIGCSASGNDQDYYFNSTNTTIGNTLSNSKAWNNRAAGTGVVVNKGMVNINGGHIYNLITGILAGSSSVKISIDNVQFSSMTLAVDASVANNNVYVGDGCIYNTVTSIRGANVKQAVRTSGVATIAIGTSSITVPHGLPSAPAFYTGSPVNTNLGGRDLWFGADATNIYINLSSNVTTAVLIMWEARTRI